MQSAFTRIYSEDQWDGGSGKGSTIENTEPYRRLLEGFISEHGVKSVVDAGCGDWQSTHLIDWKGASYIGVDVVESVIAANRARYGHLHRFECLDFSTQELPSADLLLLKEVLQHWPTHVIQELLSRLGQFKYVLITNSVNAMDGGHSLNSDIAMSGYRPLDVRLPPFNLPATELARYRTDEVAVTEPHNKLVLLYSPTSVEL